MSASTRTFAALSAPIGIVQIRLTWSAGNDVMPPPSVTIWSKVTVVGGAREPVALARAVRVGKFEREKDCTGVEVGVATEVVKMGERLPEVKEVRPPPSVTISLNVTRVGGAEEPVPLAKAVLVGKF